jgi:hypothetical protein
MAAWLLFQPICTHVKSIPTRKAAMKALVYQGPWIMPQREVPNPEPKDDELLISIKRVGICGSDVHGFIGKTRPAQASHHHRPRIQRYSRCRGRPWQPFCPQGCGHCFQSTPVSFAHGSTLNPFSGCAPAIGHEPNGKL